MTKGEILTRLKVLENRRSNVPECIVKLIDGSQRKIAPIEAVRIAFTGTAASFEELPPYDNGLLTKALNALLDI